MKRLTATLCLTLSLVLGSMEGGESKSLSQQTNVNRYWAGHSAVLMSSDERFCISVKYSNSGYTYNLDLYDNIKFRIAFNCSGNIDVNGYLDKSECSLQDNMFQYIGGHITNVKMTDDGNWGRGGVFNFVDIEMISQQLNNSGKSSVEQDKNHATQYRNLTSCL